MHASTCTATNTDDAAAVLACLFLLYSTVDLLVHGLVFAWRLA